VRPLSERLYRLLIYLYPPAHRREYGELMAHAFRDQCRAAQRQGVIAWLSLWRRTLVDAVVSMVVEHLEAQKKGIMTSLFVKTDEPGTWPEALAGAVPFIFYGAAAVAFALGQNGLLTAPGPFGWAYFIWAIFIGNALSAAVFTIGWIKGFPRWSYAVLLPMLYNTDWLSTVYLGRPSPFAGIKAWLPLLIGIAVALLWSRSVYPLWQFVKGARQDWTRFSFLLYGFLIVMVMGGIDETHGMALIPHTVAGTGFLVAGAAAYIRAWNAARRMLALVLGMAFSSVIVGAFVEMYWSGRYEPWMKAPMPELDVLSLLVRLAIGLTFSTVILLSPLLLAWLGQAVRRKLV
jgi:hypothetical protein